MCVIGITIFIATVWMVKVAEAVEAYHLDNRNLCHSTGVITKWLGNDDVIIIFGKLDPESSFTECEMVFGPGTSATKLSTVVQFQTYLNNDCNVYLLLDQSPYQFFEKDVSTVVNLTCFSTPGATKYYTDAGSNLRIKLHKSHNHLRNYNFIFNITLTDHKTVTEVSSVIIIIIGIIIAITVPLIGCIVYKALKIKRWSKRHYSSDVDLSPQVHQPLQSFDGHSTPPSVRYLSMPLGQQDAGDIIHSQTCIVGRQRADGRCTVCNRSHEDFAHVIDVDSHGIVVDDVPHRGLCHRSHEDSLHFEEASTSHSQVQSEGQRLLGRIGAPDVDSNTSSRHPNRHINTRSSRGADTRHDIDDDEEIDVSGNDLIPPSYDLCPPSYDEAIDMPTPGRIATNTSLQQQPEVDPLYQNIDDILTNR